MKHSEFSTKTEIHFTEIKQDSAKSQERCYFLDKSPV